MKTTCCIVLAAITCGAALGSTVQVLTDRGVGDVRVGMTVVDAEQALKTKLVWENPGDPDYATCDYVEPEGAKAPWVSYMVQSKRITRIDISENDSGSIPKIRTSRNIGIGSDEKEIVKAYGSTIEVTPRPYSGNPDHQLMLKSADKKRAIVFLTTKGKVDQIHVGKFPTVLYDEGCD